MQLTRGFQAVKRHPYPIVVSSWLGLIFAERVAVHLVVYRGMPSLPAAATQSSTVFAWLVTSVLCLFAMLVDRRAVTQTLGSVHRMWKKVLHELFSPFTLAATAFAIALIALFRGSRDGEAIWQSLLNIATGIWNAVVDAVGSEELTLAIGASSTYFAWLIVEAYLKRREKDVEEALYELIVAGYLIAVAGLFYLWFCATFVLPTANGPMRGEALAGLMKDTLVYTALALIVVVGMYKAGEAFQAINERWARWAVWGALAGGISVVALVLIGLDLHYREAILPTSIEYPELWQKRTIRFHVMLRLVLIVPLLLTAGLRMCGQIESINLGRRGRV